MDKLLSHIREIPVRGDILTPTAALGDEIAVLSRAVSMLQARIAGRIADQRARDPRPEGLGLTRWTALHGDLSDVEARSLVTVSRTLVSHPDTGDQIADAEISQTRARLLARAAQAHRKLYERDEEILLGFAAEQSITDLTRSLRYWRHCAEDEATIDKPQPDREAASYLHASLTMGGMVRLDGLLDPVAGEALLTTLDAATPPPNRHDSRPAPNRRAQALGDICLQWLRNGTTDGGVRAAVTLIVDLDTLEGRYGKRCELDTTGPVDRATALRILCDCDVSRVISRGESEVLDLGRSTRTPSPAQRRALTLRDRHCRYRGCDRPPKWCDAHHIDPWALGGETDLANLVLLCRYHHGLVHKGHAVVIGTEVVPDHLLAERRAPP